jgi:hypothetical protein
MMLTLLPNILKKQCCGCGSGSTGSTCFLGLRDLDPDPLVRGMDPDPDPALDPDPLVRGTDPDPDPSIIMQK